MSAKGIPSAVTSGISPLFSRLFQASRQIAHVLRTLAPLRPKNIATLGSAFDLHVLSTPPAFVLSQNQTLRRKSVSMFQLRDSVKLTGCFSAVLPYIAAVKERPFQVSRDDKIALGPFSGRGHFRSRLPPLLTTGKQISDSPFGVNGFLKNFWVPPSCGFNPEP